MARPKKAEAPTDEVVTTEKKERKRRTKDQIREDRIKSIKKEIEDHKEEIKQLEAKLTQLQAEGDKDKQEKLLKNALAGGLTLEEMAKKLGVSLD